ncbi:MAG: hypothetical protein HYR50_02885, partial [Candidatus Rokubacteria bacterium]|nr:hypothetical protein [Candidatus Rokubacteria bacterium]
DEIASAIAGNLKVKLAAPQPVGRRTDNPKAYELFLKGRHHWNRRSEAELRKGIISVAIILAAVVLALGIAIGFAIMPVPVAR